MTVDEEGFVFLWDISNQLVFPKIRFLLVYNKDPTLKVNVKSIHKSSK